MSKFSLARDLFPLVLIAYGVSKVLNKPKKESKSIKKECSVHQNWFESSGRNILISNIYKYPTDPEKILELSFKESKPNCIFPTENNTANTKNDAIVSVALYLAILENLSPNWFLDQGFEVPEFYDSIDIEWVPFTEVQYENKYEFILNWMKKSGVTENDMDQAEKKILETGKFP